MRIGLRQAVDEIAQASNDARNDAQRTSAFFFVVGAGISAPVIPTARQIEELCQARVSSRAEDGTAESLPPMERYSYWFRRAFPQSRQRQRFLEAMIADKPVSPANLRLGHLLIERSISGLVYTSNFDPFLSQSLSLFGIEHIVCDHPFLADRIDPERDVVQLVHMHGSHWHYDACNLVEEIAGRATARPRARGSMKDLFGDTLRFRSPLVIGYGGWPQDVFMRSLRDRLGEPGDGVVLPYNVYWFCHRRRQADELPVWLTRHPNVRLVVPPDVAKGRKTPPHEIDDSPTPSAVVPNAEDRLEAQEVLEAMLQAMGTKLPAITVDPLAAVAEDLRRRLGQSGAHAGADIYRIDSVLAGIERARTLLAAAVVGETQSMQHIDDAIRGSDYAEAIREAKRMDIDSLEENTSAALLETVWLAGNAISGSPSLKSDAFAIVLRLLRRMGLDEVGRRQFAGEALRHHAAASREQRHTRVALKSIDESIELLESCQPAPLLQLADAYVLKGAIHWDRKEYDQELASYARAMACYPTVIPSDAGPILARALDFTATTLRILGRVAEGNATVEQLYDRFSNSRDAEIQALVIRSVVHAGTQVADIDQRLSWLERAAHMHEDSQAPVVQAARAESLVYLGLARRIKGLKSEARDAFLEILNRYESVSVPEVQEQVAFALTSLGRLAIEENAPAEGLAYLDAVRTIDPVTREIRDRLIAAAELALTTRLDRGLPAHEDLEYLEGLVRGVRTRVASQARRALREAQRKTRRQEFAHALEGDQNVSTEIPSSATDT